VLHPHDYNDPLSAAARSHAYLHAASMMRIVYPAFLLSWQSSRAQQPSLRTALKAYHTPKI